MASPDPLASVAIVQPELRVMVGWLQKPPVCAVLYALLCFYRGTTTQPSKKQPSFSPLLSISAHFHVRLRGCRALVYSSQDRKQLLLETQEPNNVLLYNRSFYVC